MPRSVPVRIILGLARIELRFAPSVDRNIEGLNLCGETIISCAMLLFALTVLSIAWWKLSVERRYLFRGTIGPGLHHWKEFGEPKMKSRHRWYRVFRLWRRTRGRRCGSVDAGLMGGLFAGQCLREELSALQ